MEAPAGIKCIDRESEMDCERAVENDGSRHTVPDEIMNSSTPLHCLERDVAQRVHAKGQREIGEHEKTSWEAEPPERHRVAEKVGIYHLTPSPGRDAHRTNRYQYSGRGENVNLDVRFWSILLKKSLMRSVEPSDQLLRAFFIPLFVLLSGRTGEFSASVQRSRLRRGMQSACSATAARYGWQGSSSSAR